MLTPVHKPYTRIFTQVFRGPLRPMKKLLLASAMAVVMGYATGALAEGKTLRYATAGDIYGLDPDSVPDSFTNNFLQAIYEPLVRYNKDLKI